MDNFQAIGQLVTEARNLLDSIKGGAIRAMETTFNGLIADFGTQSTQAIADNDATVATKILDYDAQVRAVSAPIADQLPILALSSNAELNVTVEGGMPAGISVNSHCTLTKLMGISHYPAGRTVDAVNLTAEMTADVKEVYADFKGLLTEIPTAFNVYRLDWDFGVDVPTWLFFSQYKGVSVPISPVSSGAMIMKLTSGTLLQGVEDYCREAETGKWRFCCKTKNSTRLGDYYNWHPVSTSVTGSMLIALPVVTTGYLNHPNKLFKAPEVG